MNESKEWCDSLGRTLHVVHSDGDLVFLTEKVIGKGSPGRNNATWFGLIPRVTVQSEWTTVSITLVYPFILHTVALPASTCPVVL